MSALSTSQSHQHQHQQWWAALPLADLPPGQRRVVRHEGHQILVLHLEPEDPDQDASELLAIDNHCPHEGYPLVQGGVKGCVLTCAWHNFKFDLKSGGCLIGDEQVRTWPVRVREGQIELDLTEPDRSERIPHLLERLEAATMDGRNGQATREIARLVQAGASPLRLLAEAARLDARYGKYGPGHGLAVARDLVEVVERRPGMDAVLPIATVFELVADGHRRRPPRPHAPPLAELPEDPGGELRRLAEEEDLEGAEAILRGALAAGVPIPTLEAWLWPLATDHFLDFGHRIIYLGKLFELLERLPPDDARAVAPDILGGHLAGIILGTREDTLPTWRPAQRWLEALDAELDTLYAAARAEAPESWDPDALVELVLHGKPKALFEALTGALRAGVPHRALIDCLVEAGARRVLSFDVAIDLDPTVREGWLDVTHRFTAASALRVAFQRHPRPEVLRSLFHVAWFIRRAQPLDLPQPPEVPELEAPASAAAIIDAVAHKDGPRALGLTRAWLRERPPEDLRDALADHSVGDAAVLPIVVAHAIKMSVAAFEEYGTTGDDLPALATVRLLASPIRQRFIVRSAHEAGRFIGQGQMPRRLTG